MSKVHGLASVWIKDFSDLVLDGDKVFCKTCSKTIACGKKFQITQHVGTSVHQANSRKFKENPKSQISLRQSFAENLKKSEKDIFNLDLCEVLVTSNIPLSKLSNSRFRGFLEKYCNRSVPDESTLRKNYLDTVYINVLQQIRSHVLNSQFIYFVVDETTDACGRYIVHLLIGALDEEQPSKCYLISCGELENVNNVTISRFINESLKKFFLPHALPVNNILLMSDAAPYMVKPGRHLKIFYNNLIHVTCLAHGLNRVAEEIRLQFPIVNQLISNVKKVFVKAPLRVRLYKEKLPNTPLPPSPVLTRWGTLLNAAIFYCNNFGKITELILQLSDESAAVTAAKCVLHKPELVGQLAFIKSNYSSLSETILKLEQQEISLIESTGLINTIKESIENVKGKVGKSISGKLNDVLNKNEGFSILTKVAKILQGEFLDVELAPDLISVLKNAPITSVDVERSFSIFKYILSDRRQSFKVENIEKHIIINCFNNSNNVNELPL